MRTLPTPLLWVVLAAGVGATAGPGEGVPNVPSPVVVGDRLFLVSDQGVATRLDARTGAAKWTERLPGSYTASPLARGDAIFAFIDDGKAVVFGAADEYVEIGRNELAGRVHATPAAVGDSLIVRTDAALYRLTGAKPR